MANRPSAGEREGFIKSIELRESFAADPDQFPFTVPSVRQMGTLALHPSVTFLIGENGTGKSTILEAVATRIGFSEIGGNKTEDFMHRPLDGGLHDALVLHHSRHRRPARRFFMRAETVYDFATKEDPSLHRRSHGEAFMAIIQNRMNSEGLFLIDEPEAALSPARQLVFLKEMDWLVRSGCQFMIATHSPIIMAYPDSIIYELSDEGIRPIEYKETEHYRLTHDFLEHPNMFLRHLLG